MDMEGIPEGIVAIVMSKSDDGYYWVQCGGAKITAKGLHGLIEVLQTVAMRAYGERKEKVKSTLDN